MTRVAPRKAVRRVNWSHEPGKLEWMKAHDIGQSADALSEEFSGEFGFPLSHPQVSLFRSTYGYQTRKGHAARTQLPVGTERTMRPGTGHGYTIVKVREKSTVPMADDNWVMKHVLVWQEANGMEVPEGHCVVFADKDHRNFDPGNLVLVPKRLMYVVNGMTDKWHDAESLKACIALAELKVQRIEAQRRMERTCVVCGAKFTNEAEDRRNPVIAKKTCPKCRKEGRKGVEMAPKGTRTCLVCGEEFTFCRKSAKRCPKCVAAKPKHSVERHRACYDRTGER